jgi:cytochrome c oxidase cbb3-type subunit 2
MKDRIVHFLHSLDLSALATIIGILILFSGAVGVTLIAPNYIDTAWITPASEYQVQMYEVADPDFYISSLGGGQQLQFVHHVKNGYSLLSFSESETVKIEAPKDLEKYVTRLGNKKIKLTSRLLLLKEKPYTAKQGTVLELYDPVQEEAFVLANSDGIIQDWVDENFEILDPNAKVPFHQHRGVIFVANPLEFRIKKYQEYGINKWAYDRNGEPLKSVAALTSPPFAFSSRKELIEKGEHIYAIEGCWYCHTDQTRTLVQDVVLNGSDSFPAPPSAPNEYIYQRITFPGTKRNGPDLSRVGIKRPSRDWHKAHFWAPKTASRGSIMPAFRHFFDFDPRGTSTLQPGVPNHQFEAIYQYMMTKGTRITAPTEAWWLGLDPIRTKEIIEGKKVLP